MSSSEDASLDSILCRTPSETVIDEIAEREGVDPVEVTPCLYEVIEPDALDTLVASFLRGPFETDGRVAFSYCGYDVTVESDGTVLLDAVVENE